MDDLPARVLVVCTANVARSPLYAALLADRLGDVGVGSAGTNAREGTPAAEYTVKLAAERGLDLRHHRSRPVTADHVSGAELILTMSQRQRDACGPLAPGAGARTFTVMELTRLLQDVDPADAPRDPRAVPAWLRDRAGAQRPRSLAPRQPENVPDPIREPWQVWEQLGVAFDQLVGSLPIPGR
jgi:protein-tyrosine phosphatase